MEGSQEWEVNFKRATVKMSDGLVVQGKVNIRAFPRLSDSSEPQMIGSLWLFPTRKSHRR